MGVEWRDDLDATLVILLLLDEHLFANVEIALQSDWLHIIVLFKLNLVFTSPRQRATVLRRDVLRRMVQVVPSSLIHH